MLVFFFYGSNFIHKVEIVLLFLRLYCSIHREKYIKKNMGKMM